MAVNTKYSYDELYAAYRSQYLRSESQLGEGVSPKNEMYSKKEFIEDWESIKRGNKGMSGIRVAEKLARSDVYQYSKKQAESIYKSVYSESFDEQENLQRRIDALRKALKTAKKKDAEIIQSSIKDLQNEEKILKKESSSYVRKLRTGRLSEEDESILDAFYSDVGEYYHKLKELGYSGKEAKKEVAKKFFSWKYID